MSGDLIDTTEMYLRTIWELREEGIRPLRARIVERMGHSGPTVSQTVGRMERDGLLYVGSDREIVLTDAGEASARHVVRKHRLVERLLVDVIGLDLEHVHEEACRWEHVISDRVEERLVELLGDPHESPHGNPIPQNGGSQRVGKGVTDETSTLAVTAGEVPSTVTVLRLSEQLQSNEELTRQLLHVGVKPGASVVVVRCGDRVILGPGTDSETSLDATDANLIFITS